MYQQKPRQVYAFGQNSYGELGTISALTTVGMGDISERNEPTIVQMTSDLQVAQVAAGNELSLFLTEEGEVYMCGFFESAAGQSLAPAVRSAPHIGSFKKVESLSNQKVSRLFAHNGCEHVVALTKLGKLWVFGYNARGQLGLGDTKNVAIPLKQETLWRKVVRTVGTSYYHSIFACEELETYGCGRNDNGQLGIGASADVLFPTLIEDLNGHMVVSVGCGQYHTVVATAAGQVFAFGKNENGQLGVTPYQPIQKRPARVLDLEAKQVACGYYHTLAIGSNKLVYAWGKNDSGQLGLGDKAKVLVPTVVERLARTEAVQVACGCYHSLVFTSMLILSTTA